MSESIPIGVLLQRCRGCAEWNLPSLERCPTDPAHELEDVRTTGRGVVYSWTTTHVAFTPAARDAVPYVTLLVELEEGPRVLTHLAPEHEVVRIGQGVEVWSLREEQSPIRPVGALVAKPLSAVDQ